MLRGMCEMWVGICKPAPMEEGKSYEIKSAVTNLYNEKFQDIQSGSGLIKRCPECNRKPFLQQKSFISL
jgi:hypothetical protein